MDKFNAIFTSIKRDIISESFNNNECFIDLNLDLISKKYADEQIDLEKIEENNKLFNVKIELLDDTKRSVRLISSKQKLEGLLGTFINSEKFDEVSAWILLSGEKYGNNEKF